MPEPPNKHSALRFCELYIPPSSLCLLIFPTTATLSVQNWRLIKLCWAVKSGGLLITWGSLTCGLTHPPSFIFPSLRNVLCVNEELSLTVRLLRWTLSLTHHCCHCTNLGWQLKLSVNSLTIQEGYGYFSLIVKVQIQLSHLKDEIQRWTCKLSYKQL